MATYGNQYKRRRNTRKTNNDLFSSDDEDHGEYTHSQGKLLTYDMIDEAFTMSPGHKLLPAAHISTRSSKRRQETINKTQLEVLNDEEIGSPKKYCEVVRALGTPKKMKTRVTPKSPSSGAFSEGKGRNTGDKPEKHVFESPTKIRRVSSCSSPSTTPRRSQKEKNAWDSLFGSLVKSKGSPEKFSVQKRLEAAQKDISQSSDHTTVDVKTLSQVDLDQIYSTLNQSGVFVNDDGKLKRDSRERCKDRAGYGDRRSYIMEQKNEEKEGLDSSGSSWEKDARSEKTDTNSDEEFQENTEVADINDLRSLGKKNSIKEELEYLLEGIYFVDGGKIEQKNTILINSLIDLQRKDTRFLKASGDTILSNLQEILKSIPRDENGGRLIISLIQQNMRALIAKDVISALDLDELCICFLFDDVTYNLDDLRVLPITKESLITYCDTIEIPDLLLKVLDSTFVYSRTVFEKVKGIFVPTYFEEYFSRFPTHPITDIQQHIDLTLQKIRDKNIDDSVNQILRILVVTSTGGSQFDESYVPALYQLILEAYDSIIRGNEDDRLHDAALFSMGYILNYIEHSLPRDSETMQFLKSSISKLSNFPASTTSAIHLAGYNCLVLSLYKGTLSLPLQLIREKLQSFDNSISNPIIKLKVSLAILDLG